MKKIKIINSLLLGSIVASTPIAILSSCSKQEDNIELVRGEKEVLYTNKTQSVNLIFKAKDAKAISGLKVKVTNLTASGAEAKPVAGLIKTRYDSGGNIVVALHPQVFKAQWPQATLKFSLHFYSKETGFDQTMDGFSLAPVSTGGDYDMDNGSYDVMESPVHDVTAGVAYTYTCKFSFYSWAERYRYFSFLKKDYDNEEEESELLTIYYVNVTKNGEALIQGDDYDFVLLDENDQVVEENGKVIKLSLDQAPAVTDEFVFEIVFAEDGHGKFINAARESSLDMDGTICKGFKSNVSDEEIEEEFTDVGSVAGKNCISFYSHITEIAENAFNNSLETVRKIPGSYDSISFYKATGPVKIGRAAFAENAGLVEFELPLDPELLGGYIQEIGELAFAYCTSLKGDISTSALAFEEGLTTVGTGAFNHCESILSVTIPASCTTIGNGAFSYMTNLNTIDFSAWTAVPTITSTVIFEQSGTANPTATKGQIKIASGQSEASWKTWLTTQGIDWNHWEIKVGA